MKTEYIKPEIELIRLDNEISLILESSPPEGPGEGMLIVPGSENNNPFNNSYLV